MSNDSKSAFVIRFQTEMLHCVYFVVMAAREPDDAERRKLVDTAADYIGRTAEATYDEMVRIAQHGGLT